ncbi:gliding motility-associated C-terminal domain-containing protein [Dokdonia sp. Asnod3-C12]|uniref:T9SS type B sorting domain-containing protein n=1 Tax=Dokdonia sp. Asnod3-C12 TaxID=3160575 RepID=UPI00386E9890
MGKLYLFLTLLLCSTVTAFSQCAEVETFTVCDMTVVDGNGDSIPDGIINLYEEFSAITGTTITPADGMWFDPNFNFALDVVTGDLYLWDLDSSSEDIADYQFEFLNGATGCPDDVQFLFNVVLGPFAGNPVPPSGSGMANVSVCEAGLVGFDLFQVFGSIPAPHENGFWTFIGNDGDPSNFQFLSQNGRFGASIPYTPNDGSLVDSDVFEFTYTVPGISPCVAESTSNFRVEVVRDVQAGDPGSEFICQSEMVAGGIWDRDIRLASEYLVNEDIEGTWSSDFDPSGQISGPGDDVINIYEAYLDFVTNNGQDIGCLTFGYTYTVEPRINLANCNEKLSTITFTIAEEIRPFFQDNPYEICEDADTPSTINLYDQLEFTTEVWNNPSTGMDQDILFDYPNENCTNWELVSGPSGLGILSNTGMVPGTSSIDWCSAYILGIGWTTDYRSTGTINFQSAEPGTYVFRYTVLPSYHCQVVDTCNTDASCTHPCDIQTADVTVIVHPKNYAGEDTADLEICETESPIVLTDLLDVNETEASIYVGEDGVWTNTANGDVVDNNFEIPSITDSQLFNFEYNTITENGCEDSATLSFTVYEQYDPGESGPLAVCSDAAEVDLFTLLGGTPDTNGTWSGPDGFTTTDNVALFTPGTSVEGEYIYTVPANGTCLEASTTVDVTLGDAIYAGEDTTGVELCNTTTTVDLITLLEDNGTDTIDTNGDWTDSSGAVIVNPFTIPSITDSQTFEFIYTTGGGGCEDTATLSFTVFEQGDAGIDAAYETCEDGTTINLFTLLGGTPDINGTWSGPNGYTTTDNEANFDPSVNTEGAYIYTIAANDACEAVTATVTVSFFATNYAGEDTTGVELCDNSFTNPLDLISLLETNGTDAVYVGTQGVWTDTVTGDVVSNPFTVPAVDGQQVFNYTYTTTTDDGCGDAATLSFTVFEQGDAGLDAAYETCEDGTTVNLFTLLGGMPDTNGTWSGPSSFTTTDNNAVFDPSVNSEGAYIYTIAANGACEAVTATVTVSFFATNYAGEDTTGVELCDDSFTNPIDLISLLETNGTDTIYVGTQGIWTDTATGAVISNPITVPAVNEQQVFDFTYTTTTDDGCGDVATLSFIVFESSNAGTGGTFQACEDGAIVDLFTILGGSPDINGSWSGPEGYATADNNGSIDPMTAVNGDYVYSIAANGACDAVSATISVSIVPVSNAGDDIDTFVCAGDYTTSLFGLLSNDAQLTGEFINIDTSETVIDGLIDVGALGEGTFSYLYIVFTDACGQDDATITFTITPVMAPTVVLIEPFICINDGVTLGNLVVSVEDFVWYASAEGGDPLPLSTLLVDETTYYVSAVDDNGCESPRVPYLADVLPLSDGRCQIQISDGVSDNDDGQNDFLELGTLPNIFPNFDIQIFNRYGTIVYRGNRNTPLFDGSSNTGSGLGDQLPTGVYFYIFYPNDSNSEPIDGSFYLSR